MVKSFRSRHCLHLVRSPNFDSSQAPNALTKHQNWLERSTSISFVCLAPRLRSGSCFPVNGAYHLGKGKCRGVSAFLGQRRENSGTWSMQQYPAVPSICCQTTANDWQMHIATSHAIWIDFAQCKTTSDFEFGRIFHLVADAGMGSGLTTRRPNLVPTRFQVQPQAETDRQTDCALLIKQ